MNDYAEWHQKLGHIGKKRMKITMGEVIEVPRLRIEDDKSI